MTAFSKGRVEASIKYIRDSFSMGSRFRRGFRRDLSPEFGPDLAAGCRHELRYRREQLRERCREPGQLLSNLQPGHFTVSLVECG